MARFNNRDTHVFSQLFQLIFSKSSRTTITGVNAREASINQHFGGFLNCILVSSLLGLGANTVLLRRFDANCAWIAQAVENILWNQQVSNTWSTCGSGTERLANHVWQAVPVINLTTPLTSRFKYIVLISNLHSSLLRV